MLFYQTFDHETYHVIHFGADIVFRALQDEWLRNLTIMRAHWQRETVVHW